MGAFLFSSLSFRYQYQCNWLPGKIRPRNDLLCVEWDVKPCSTQLTEVTLTTSCCLHISAMAADTKLLICVICGRSSVCDSGVCALRQSAWVSAWTSTRMCRRLERWCWTSAELIATSVTQLRRSSVVCVPNCTRPRVHVVTYGKWWILLRYNARSLQGVINAHL